MSLIKKISIYFSLFIVGVLVSIVTVIWMGHLKLQSRMDAYVAAGNTLDLTEFAPPSVPDDENAAVAYRLVFATLKALPQDEQGLFGDETLYDDPDLIAVLEKCAPSLDDLRAATKMPKCNWDIQYGLGLDVLLPHLADIRLGAKLLKSNIYVTNNAPEGASAEDRRARDEMITHDIESMIRLGLHTQEDSTLIGQLVAASVLAMATDVYEDIFRNRPAPVQHGVIAILEQFDHRADFRRSLQTEVLMIQGTFDNLKKRQSNAIQVPPFAVSLLGWDRAYYFDTMANAIAATDAPIYESPPIPDGPWYALTTNMLLPALDRAELALAKTQTKIEMLKTAELLRTYKAEHGQYPAPGVIEMPIDPTTGNRLVYEIVDDGFKLTGAVGNAIKNKIEWVWH